MTGRYYRQILRIEAMRAASFSVLHIERRHEVAGLIAVDLFRKTQVWLVDVGLERSAPDGWMFATRVYTPDQFYVTAGVSAPLSDELIVDLAAELP